MGIKVRMLLATLGVPHYTQVLPRQLNKNPPKSSADGAGSGLSRLELEERNIRTNKARLTTIQLNLKRQFHPEEPKWLPSAPTRYAAVTWSYVSGMARKSDRDMHHDASLRALEGYLDWTVISGQVHQLRSAAAHFPRGKSYSRFDMNCL
jgi:hypothetical protein